MNRKPHLRVAELFERSEAIRGYALVSPAIIVASVTLVFPVGLLILTSFWTQNDSSMDRTFTLDNYASFFLNRTYLQILLRTFAVSLATTAFVIILAYPVAAYIAFRVKTRKSLLLLLIMAAFWTSYLLRIFAWKVILGYNGIINSGLIWAGLIEKPIDILLYNSFAVVLTLTHAWAPFALLPIYLNLEKIDKSYLEAARDLGDSWWATFRRVVLPLSMPGLVAASLIVFVPTVGEYVTPQLVGGTSGLMIGNVVQSMFGRANNWPLGAAIAISTMIIVIFVTAFFFRTIAHFRGAKR